MLQACFTRTQLWLCITPNMINVQSRTCFTECNRKRNEFQSLKLVKMKPQPSSSFFILRHSLACTIYFIWGNTALLYCTHQNLWFLVLGELLFSDSNVFVFFTHLLKRVEWGRWSVKTLISSSELLLLPTKRRHFLSKTTNQSREEGLSAANHTSVPATTFPGKLWPPSVAMLTSLSCIVAESKGTEGEWAAPQENVTDSTKTLFLCIHW